MKKTKTTWLADLPAEEIVLEEGETMKVYCDLLNPKNAPGITYAHPNDKVLVVYHEGSDRIAHIQINNDGLLFNVNYEITKEMTNNE